MARPSLTRDTKVLRGTLQPVRDRARGEAPEAPDVTPAESARDFMALAEGYCEDVRSGRIVACSWLKKAVERFTRMQAAATVPDNPYVFSPEHVQDVCAFAEQCPHVEGSWGTDTLVLQAWQVFVLAACYGFRLRETDRRLVTTVFFQVARKSAKSTLVAVMGLYHLVVEKEPGAQVICGASTGQQARIVFGVMQRMVRRSSWLRSQGLTAFAHAITFEAYGSSAKPINSKSSTQDGLNPSFISLDESHAQDFSLHDVLKSAMGARPDGVLWAPTTAGYSLTSVGYALRATAMKILDGVIQSDHTFVVLYELDPDDDWRDESVWVKAAPMIGITPTLDYVRKYCADAQATQSLQGEFEVKICNRWLHSSSRWLSVDAWDKCADPTLTLNGFEGERVYLGVDLAERDDIAALAVVFRRDDAIYSFVRGYLPSLVVNERAQRVPEYRTWVQGGELITTPGNMTDFRTIEADIRAICDKFDVAEIVIEQYGANNLIGNLQEDGYPVRSEHKSPKVFTTPAKELEARINARQWRHNGASFLKWQISNTCVERRRDGSLLPMKDAAESPNKIDAVDAIILALSALVLEPERKSLYDREDFDPASVWI